MKLYHYWRSSSSWRVRLALAHKHLKPEMIPVNLLDGESESAAHTARNPTGFVPVLELDDGTHLIESVAICEYLEETHAQRPLLPQNPLERARIRAVCEVINSGIQPLHNPTVTERVSTDAAVQKEWMQFWIARGLVNVETLIRGSGQFCFGDSFTLADCFVVPLIYGAIRNEVDLRPTPKIATIYENCLKTPAGMESHPDRFKPA